MSAAPKAVGILGGMGPYATAAFFQTLLKLTPAQKDWDHLRVIIDNNPHIPSRTRHLLYQEPSPVPGMLDSCLRLQSYPVDLIAIPCNSASIHVPELQAHLSIPLLNIIEITADALGDRHPGVTRAAVLGGYVTYKTKSYEPFLRARGIELLDHGADIQGQVARLIEVLKLGYARDEDEKCAMELISQLQRQFGAQSIILACTEFGCLSALKTDVPVVDSSSELARRTITMARR